MTILVGPNNSGKSAILEAIQFLQNNDTPAITKSQRNGATGGRFAIEYATDDGPRILAAQSEGGPVVWEQRPNRTDTEQIFVVPSRRALEAKFGTGPGARTEFNKNTSALSLRSPYRALSGRIIDIDRDKAHFNELLFRILGKHVQWYLEDAGNGQFYIEVTGPSHSHSGDGLGDGLLALFVLVDALRDFPEGHTLVIDEPELSFHPATQRRFAEVLAEFSSRRQIILATHSPYFVNWAHIEHGARLFRVFVGEGSSTIAGLTDATAADAIALLRDRQNPHLLGLEAREVFFLEDGAILVEGADDRFYYPEIAAQLGVRLGGSYYGWGTGGAANMPTIAAILHDLGFQRVVGFLDQGQEKILAGLKHDFPQYCFQVIPARDVLTKDPRKATERVEGLLDEAKQLRSQHRDEIARILSVARDALSELDRPNARESAEITRLA